MSVVLQLNSSISTSMSHSSLDLGLDFSEYETKHVYNIVFVCAGHVYRHQNCSLVHQI